MQWVNEKGGKNRGKKQMTEFQSNDPIIQKIWDRLRVLLGAKVNKIKNKNDLEKVAKKYKTLSKYEKTGLLKKSNIFNVIKEEKMQVFVKGYKDKRGHIYKAHYRPITVHWTKKEIVKLKMYNERGRTPNQIASYLGRSPNAVKQKLRKV